jgi:hypothetical protein
MFIAQQKKKENIAEYVLYMFQVEDLIRAYDLNLDQIMDKYIIPQLPDQSFVGQYREWYQGLIRNMIFQRIEKQGHLAEIIDVFVELSYLHNSLIGVTKDQKYITLFEAALPFIEEFKEKSNLKDKNEIEIAFNALYMKLLLRLQKKEISAETEEAFDNMRILLAYLSKAYHQMKNTDFNYNLN